MSRALPLLLGALVLAACATEVSHPSKSLAEQQVDIDHCTGWANDKYWMDPIAALLNAYDCLEGRGYRKGKSGFEDQVKRSAADDRVRRTGSDPTKPCAVPCRPKR